MATLREQIGGTGRKAIVRVDRTELSKNIVRGLLAYRQLLEDQPEWRERVVHVAFAYPSRQDLAVYREYTAEVQRVADEINAAYGTPGWTPVLLHVNDDFARSLAAYRLADVALVNPIRDGMNLVAKEVPVVSDEGCALVLSREAGAYEELGEDAIVVNPYDVSATAGALHEALTMRSGERAERTKRLAAAATPAAGAVVPGAAARRCERALTDSAAIVQSRAGRGPRGSRPRLPARPAPGPPARPVPATSALPLHTSRPGMPSAAELVDGGERGEVAEVVAGVEDGLGADLAYVLRGARRPCPCRAGAVPGRGGPARRSGRAGPRGRPAGSRSASKAACGSAARRVWTASARPFSSIQVPCQAPTESRNPGSSARTAATPGCGAGAWTVPVTASQRSAP